MKNKINIDQPTKNMTPDTQSVTDRQSIDQLKSYKKHWEPRWYLSQAFYEGVHFTYPKKDATGNWQRRNEFGKNKVIREIPKAKKQLDSIRNLILKLKQRPVVYPDSNIILADNVDPIKQEQEKDAAELQARYVDHYMNQVMKLARHKKKLIRYAELYHVAYIQILNDNGKKEFAVYDPFEISIFPTISNINEYPMLAKHVSHRFEDLVGNDLYDQEAIGKLQRTAAGNGSGQYSGSIYKDSYMRERYGNAPKDNVLVDELYQIVKVNTADGQVVDNEEQFQADFAAQNPAVQNEDGTMGEAPTAPEMKEEERLRVRAYIGTEKVRDEITNLSKIPISMFVWGDEAYSTSIMEDLMPLNKAYDIFMSKLEHKAKKLDTGRIVMQKSEDAKILTTNDGEFMRYKRFKPEMMDEAGVPNAFMEAVNMIESDMKELGVAMTSAAGLPTGVEAWRAIESLKEADASSIGTQLDNLNECLTDLTEKLTEMMAYDMTEEENVQMKDANGQMQTYRVVGKRGADIMTQGGGAMNANTIVLDPSRTTLVEIESDLTWTKEGQRYFVLDLVKEGILPKETALETLKFGNTKDVVAKLIQEASYGKSMIDMPDFQVLPDELKKQILTILSNGAPQGGSAIPTVETAPPVQAQQ
jgi:hypothetical protein